MNVVLEFPHRGGSMRRRTLSSFVLPVMLSGSLVACGGTGSTPEPGTGGSNASSGGSTGSGGSGGGGGALATGTGGAGGGHPGSGGGNGGPGGATGSGGSNGAGGGNTGPGTASTEDTGADCPVGTVPGNGTKTALLPDPFKKLDGTEMTKKTERRCR